MENQVQNQEQKQKPLVPPQNIKIGKYLIITPIIFVLVLSMISGVITMKYNMGGLPTTAPPQYTNTETVILDIISSFSSIIFPALLIWIPIGIYYVRKKKVLIPEKRSEKNKKIAKVLLSVSLAFFIIIMIVSAVTSYSADETIQRILAGLRIIAGISVAICIPLAIHYYRKEEDKTVQNPNHNN